MEKYILTLTPDQARMVSNACELYARLKLGQFENIPQALLDYKKVGDFCARRDLSNDLLKIVAGIIFGKNEYSQPKIEKDPLFYRAWNIHATLRYHIAWHEHPEGGWGTHFDKPYEWGGEPVPECRVEESNAEENPS